MKRELESLRLFVAAYPPIEIARTLSRAVPKALLPFVRITAPDQIHLTLMFLGRVMPKELDAVAESVERSCAGLGPFQLSFEKLTALPHRGPKRVIVATTNAPTHLLEIRSRLTRRLSRQSRERPNDRFLPHFTVARFEQPQTLMPDEALSLGQISISEIRLMRSQLMPEGARHSLVHGCELK
jgi:2'-5' RNA ligase